MTAPKHRRLLGGAIPAIVLAAGSLLPAARPLPFEICLLYRLTGFPCLTCGLTRSVCFLLQGDLSTSLAMHPAGGLVVLLLVLHVLWNGCEAILGRVLARRALDHLTGALGAAGAVFSAAVWIVRIARG